MLKQVFVSATLTLMVASAAHADNFDTRLARQCPATAAWAKKAHASRGRSEKERKAYDATHHFSEPTLREELSARYSKDQKVREEWIADHYSEASGKAMMAVDADNLAWLKPLIKKHGFPIMEQVGYEGMSHAWMLVQHAMRDPALQARVLQEIKPRLGSGGITKDDYALLTDRVREEKHKPQVYGTQFTAATGKDGKPEMKDGHVVMKLYSLEDPKHVDQRRASMGLMPLADYECMLEVMYTPATESKPAASKPAK